MSTGQFFAGKGTCTIRAKTINQITGALVDPDSITVEIRRCPNVDQPYWEAGTVVQAAATMSSYATGIYYYALDLSTLDRGNYVAEVTVTRGGVIDADRHLLVLL